MQIKNIKIYQNGEWQIYTLQTVDALVNIVSDLQPRMTDAEDRLSSLEQNGGSGTLPEYITGTLQENTMTNKADKVSLGAYVDDYSGAYLDINANGTFVKDNSYTLQLPNKSGTLATIDDIADGVSEAKTYADTKSSAALSSAKSYTDTEIAKINVSGGSFSGTMFDQHTANDYTYTSIVKMDPNSGAMPTDSGLKVEYSKKRNGGSFGNDTKNTTTYTSDGVVLRHDHDNYSYGGQDYYDMTLNASSLDFTKRVPNRINNLGGTHYAFDTKYEVSKFKLSAPLENRGVISKDDLSTVKFALPTDAEMKDGKMPYFETVSLVKDYSNGYRDMQSYKLELPRSTGTLAIYPTTSYAKGDYDSPAVVTINSSTPVSIYFKIGPENTYTGAKGHNYSKFMGFHMPDIGIFVTYEELLHAYSCYKNYTKFLSIGGSSSVNNGDSGLMISTIKNDALYLIQVHNIDKIFDEDNNQRFEIDFHCMQVTSRQGHIGNYNIGRVYAVQETLTEKITNSFNPGSGY